MIAAPTTTGVWWRSADEDPAAARLARGRGKPDQEVYDMNGSTPPFPAKP